MKKLFSLILAAVMCISFAACGGNGNETQQGGSSTAETVVSTTLNRSIYDEVNGCFTNSYTQLTDSISGTMQLITLRVSDDDDTLRTEVF